MLDVEYVPALETLEVHLRKVFESMKEVFGGLAQKNVVVEAQNATAQQTWCFCVTTCRSESSEPDQLHNGSIFSSGACELYNTNLHAFLSKA